MDGSDVFKSFEGVAALQFVRQVQNFAATVHAAAEGPQATHADAGAAVGEGGGDGFGGLHSSSVSAKCGQSGELPTATRGGQLENSGSGINGGGGENGKGLPAGIFETFQELMMNFKGGRDEARSTLRGLCELLQECPRLLVQLSQLLPLELKVFVPPVDLDFATQFINQLKAELPKEKFDHFALLLLEHKTGTLDPSDVWERSCEIFDDRPELLDSLLYFFPDADFALRRPLRSRAAERVLLRDDNSVVTTIVFPPDASVAADMPKTSEVVANLNGASSPGEESDCSFLSDVAELGTLMDGENNECSDHENNVAMAGRGPPAESGNRVEAKSEITIGATKREIDAKISSVEVTAASCSGRNPGEETLSEDHKPAVQIESSHDGKQDKRGRTSCPEAEASGTVVAHGVGGEHRCLVGDDECVEMKERETEGGQAGDEQTVDLDVEMKIAAANEDRGAEDSGGAAEVEGLTNGEATSVSGGIMSGTIADVVVAGGEAAEVVVAVSETSTTTAKKPCHESSGMVGMHHLGAEDVKCFEERGGDDNPVVASSGEGEMGINNSSDGVVARASGEAFDGEGSVDRADVSLCRRNDTADLKDGSADECVGLVGGSTAVSVSSAVGADSEMRSGPLRGLSRESEAPGRKEDENVDGGEGKVAAPPDVSGRTGDARNDDGDQLMIASSTSTMEDASDVFRNQSSEVQKTEDVDEDDVALRPNIGDRKVDYDLGVTGRGGVAVFDEPPSSKDNGAGAEGKEEDDGEESKKSDDDANSKNEPSNDNDDDDDDDDEDDDDEDGDSPCAMERAMRYGSLENDFQLYERIYREMKNPENFTELAKLLQIYMIGLLSLSEFLLLVEDIFPMHVPHLAIQFKRLILSREKARRKRSYYIVPLSQLDYSKCKRISESYMTLPENFRKLECSGRIADPRGTESLNDNYVSIPQGSESTFFKQMRKNASEETLFRLEDEMFEFDMIIRNCDSTIKALEPFEKQILNLSEENRKKYVLEDSPFKVFHLKTFSRIYGDHAAEVLEFIRRQPDLAVLLVIARLREKHAEWRRARDRLNRVVWEDTAVRSYYRAFDHRGTTAQRAAEKSMLAIPSLLWDAFSAYCFRRGLAFPKSIIRHFMEAAPEEEEASASSTAVIAELAEECLDTESAGRHGKSDTVESGELLTSAAVDATSDDSGKAVSHAEAVVVPSKKVGAEVAKIPTATDVSVATADETSETDQTLRLVAPEVDDQQQSGDFGLVAVGDEAKDPLIHLHDLCHDSEGDRNICPTARSAVTTITSGVVTSSSSARPLTEDDGQPFTASANDADDDAEESTMMDTGGGAVDGKAEVEDSTVGKSSLGGDLQEAKPDEVFGDCVEDGNGNIKDINEDGDQMIDVSDHHPAAVKEEPLMPSSSPPPPAHTGGDRLRRSSSSSGRGPVAPSLPAAQPLSTRRGAARGQPTAVSTSSMVERDGLNGGLYGLLTSSEKLDCIPLRGPFLGESIEGAALENDTLFSEAEYRKTVAARKRSLRAALGAANAHVKSGGIARSELDEEVGLHNDGAPKNDITGKAEFEYAMPDSEVHADIAQLLRLMADRSSSASSSMKARVEGFATRFLLNFFVCGTDTAEAKEDEEPKNEHPVDDDSQAPVKAGKGRKRSRSAKGMRNGSDKNSLSKATKTTGGGGKRGSDVKDVHMETDDTSVENDGNAVLDHVVANEESSVAESAEACERPPPNLAQQMTTESEASDRVAPAVGEADQNLGAAEVPATAEDAPLCDAVGVALGGSALLLPPPANNPILSGPECSSSGGSSGIISVKPECSPAMSSECTPGRRGSFAVRWPAGDTSEGHGKTVAHSDAGNGTRSKRRQLGGRSRKGSAAERATSGAIKSRAGSTGARNVPDWEACTWRLALRSIWSCSDEMFASAGCSGRWPDVRDELRDDENRERAGENDEGNDLSPLPFITGGIGYCAFRYYRMLYERLAKCKELCMLREHAKLGKGSLTSQHAMPWMHFEKGQPQKRFSYQSYKSDVFFPFLKSEITSDAFEDLSRHALGNGGHFMANSLNLAQMFYRSIAHCLTDEWSARHFALYLHFRSAMQLSANGRQAASNRKQLLTHYTFAAKQLLRPSGIIFTISWSGPSRKTCDISLNLTKPRRTVSGANNQASSQAASGVAPPAEAGAADSVKRTAASTKGFAVRGTRGPSSSRGAPAPGFCPSLLTLEAADVSPPSPDTFDESPTPETAAALSISVLHPSEQRVAQAAGTLQSSDATGEGAPFEGPSLSNSIFGQMAAGSCHWQPANFQRLHREGAAAACEFVSEQQTLPRSGSTSDANGATDVHDNDAPCHHDRQPANHARGMGIIGEISTVNSEDVGSSDCRPLEKTTPVGDAADAAREGDLSMRDEAEPSPAAGDAVNTGCLASRLVTSGRQRRPQQFSEQPESDGEGEKDSGLSLRKRRCKRRVADTMTDGEKAVAAGGGEGEEEGGVHADRLESVGVGGMGNEEETPQTEERRRSGRASRKPSANGYRAENPITSATRMTTRRSSAAKRK